MDLYNKYINTQFDMLPIIQIKIIYHQVKINPNN